MTHFPLPPSGTAPSLQVAQARHHTYTLFGRLFLEGITPALLPYAQAIPELRPHLPHPFDPDQAAADHHHLFAFNLFPYETIFLDTTGLLDGETTQAVAHVYEEAGYIVDPATPAPDHLGHQLRYLAHLTAAEAAAWQANQPDQAHHWQARQHHFLHNHLLRWLIPCAVALQHLPNPFYATLAHLTLALTTDHHATLAPSSFILHPSPFTLPDAPQSPISNLRPFIHHLLTPAHSGFYLTRYHLEQLARQLNLPHGFGRRHDLFRNLWEAAGQYNQLPPLLTALQTHLADWQTAYQSLDDPTLTPFLHPWQTRLHQTQHHLTTLASTSIDN